jgi:iron-sulfur cluster repair protein YtfE (RIC family)
MNEESKTLQELRDEQAAIPAQIDKALESLNAREIAGLNRKKRVLSEQISAGEIVELKKKINALQAEHEANEEKLKTIQPQLEDAFQHYDKKKEEAMVAYEAWARLGVIAFGYDQSKLSIHEDLIDLENRLAAMMKTQGEKDDE